MNRVAALTSAMQLGCTKRPASYFALGIADQGQQTEKALEELFVRICLHLGIDPKKHTLAMPDSAAFRLMQTLEEHMQSEFPYTTIMDDHLLVHIKPGSPLNGVAGFKTSALRRAVYPSVWSAILCLGRPRSAVRFN